MSALVTTAFGYEEDPQGQTALLEVVPPIDVLESGEKTREPTAGTLVLLQEVGVEDVSVADLISRAQVGYGHEVIEDSEVTARSLTYYQLINDRVLRTHPQVSCLSDDEFQTALADERVGKITLTDEKGQVHIPVLAPIETYSWLSEEYYGDTFPDRQVTHFSYLPGFMDQLGDKLPEGMQDELRDLIASDGVVVYDIPGSDPAYGEFIHQTLRTISGEPLPEDKQIGNQHYFASQLKYEDGFDDWDYPMDMMDTYHRMVALGQAAPEDTQDGAIAVTELTNGEAEQWWIPYSAGFEPLNKTNPCRQGMTHDEFIEAMANKDIIKSISFDGGKPVSLLFMGPRMELFPWISPAFYANDPRFARDSSLGKVMYFPHIVVNPEMEGSGRSGDVIGLLTKLGHESHNSFIVTFDTCDDNARKVPKIVRIGVKLFGVGDVDFKEIANHSYHAIDFSEAAQAATA